MIRYPYPGNGFSDFKDKAKHYDPEFLTRLLASMIRIRRVEEELEKRYPEDEIKNPIHLAIGQEATAVGACAALARTDRLYCSHRTHGPYLAKGGSLEAMLCELYGRANGCCGSRSGSMHLIDRAAGLSGTSAIVAGAVPIAAGSAFASQLRGDGACSAVFFGEAANEEGVVWETVNFAALKKLPVVFFCENNFYSVCSPLHQRQAVPEMHRKAEAFGVPSEKLDGTNVLAVYEATRRAIERARSGGGPTYLEATVYRWRSHQGAGEDSLLGYRSADELGDWSSRACPIRSYTRFLMDEGALKEEALSDMEREASVEIERAFAFAISSPLPDPSSLPMDSYAVD